MVLTLSSNDDSHEGDHYPKIIVSLVTYPSAQHTNAYDFLVRLKPSCKYDVFSALLWVTNGLDDLPQFTHIIEEDSGQLIEFTSISDTLDEYCDPAFRLYEVSGGSEALYTGSVV